jgi:Ca2+-transporting ATPase
VICTDKTGTLTKNEMTVKKIWLPAEGEIEIEGSGYKPSPKVEAIGKLKDLIRAAYFCNNAKLAFDEKDKKWIVIGDPTEGSLRVLGSKAQIEKEAPTWEKISENSFDSKIMRMSTIYEKDGQNIVFAKGAPESIINVCKLDEAQKSKIEKEVTRLSHNGFRILAVAQKEINDIGNRKQVEDNLEFLGLVALIDPPAENIAEAIKLVQGAKIKPVIITGDHKLTALSVAHELGLNVSQDNIITGEELEKLNSSQLTKIIDNIILFARTSPMQKMRILEAFKKKKYLIAMTGDGINDAPAIKEADIGIAMGQRGQDIAKEASDIVLVDDRFSTIEKAVEYARTIHENIYKFITFLLAGNYDELFLVMITFLVGLPQPLTTLQILWINLITDSLPALALAFEKPPKDIMKRPPTNHGHNQMRRLITYALSIGLLGLIIGLILYFGYLPAGEVKMRTIVFTVVVMFELFVVFSIRTRTPFWRNPLSLFSNKFLIFAIFVSMLLQIIALYTPLAKPMGTVGLNIVDWFIIIGLCLISFLILEAAKMFQARSR